MALSVAVIPDVRHIPAMSDPSDTSRVLLAAWNFSCVHTYHSQSGERPSCESGYSGQSSALLVSVQYLAEFLS
jgi:hypothetical protein